MPQRRSSPRSHFSTIKLVSIYWFGRITCDQHPSIALHLWVSSDCQTSNASQHIVLINFWVQDLYLMGSRFLRGPVHSGFHFDPLTSPGLGLAIDAQLGASVKKGKKKNGNRWLDPYINDITSITKRIISYFSYWSRILIILMI